MVKPPTDTSGLGYSYHLPTGGLLLRIRNTLSQFSDIFSEFNKYIAPAYHHDRCERSVHMRLYSMHKREFVMVFLAFLACFGLGTFIGLAGPPITKTTKISATSLLSNTSAANDKHIMATGPFIMRSPLMTTYSQQMWLIAKLETGNSDDERFDKSFQVSVSIEGLTEDHKPVTVLNPTSAKNRYFKIIYAFVEQLCVAVYNNIVSCIDVLYILCLWYHVLYFNACHILVFMYIHETAVLYVTFP